MSPEAIAAVVGVIAALTMGWLTLRAAISTDFDIDNHLSWEKHKKDLPARHRKITRIQRVLLALGTLCLASVGWAIWVFLQAAKPGEDPESTGAAFFVVGLGLLALCVCFYQAARMGVRRKAIMQLQRERRENPDT